MNVHTRYAIFLILFLVCSGAYSAEAPSTIPAAAQPELDGTRDPWERMNRVIYRFNKRVDRAGQTV